MTSGYSTFFWRMSPSFDVFVTSCIYNLFYDFLVENTRSNFIKKTFCRNNISIFFALIHIHPNSLQKHAHIMRNRDFLSKLPYIAVYYLVAVFYFIFFKKGIQR